MMLKDIAHKHDMAWIESQLSMLHPMRRDKARNGYISVYREYFESEPVEHKKINAARRAANIRLREYVKKECQIQNRRPDLGQIVDRWA